MPRGKMYAWLISWLFEYGSLSTMLLKDLNYQCVVIFLLYQMPD